MSDLGPESAIRLAHAQAAEIARLSAEAAAAAGGDVGAAYVDCYQTVFRALVRALADRLPAPSE